MLLCFWCSSQPWCCHVNESVPSWTAQTALQTAQCPAGSCPVQTCSKWWCSIVQTQCNPFGPVLLMSVEECSSLCEVSCSLYLDVLIAPSWLSSNAQSRPGPCVNEWNLWMDGWNSGCQSKVWGQHKLALVCTPWHQLTYPDPQTEPVILQSLV